MTPWIILAIMAAFAAGVTSAILLRARAPGVPESAGHQARGTELSNGPGDHSEAGTLATSAQPALAESPTEGMAQSGLSAGQRVGRMAALGGLAALVLVDSTHRLNNQSRQHSSPPLPALKENVQSSGLRPSHKVPRSTSRSPWAG